mgnify:CR=1 FL=1
MGLSLLQDRMRGIMIQLQTKFSRQVDEHNVLPEYPRPSLVRTSYLNLNGRWECAFSKTPEIPLSFDLSILVPFSPECQLSGVSRQLKPGEYLWYRRTITLAKPQQDKRILLHFGAADQTAEVFVNRISAVRHCGGYLPFSADITDYLQEGDNELIVRIQDESNTSWHARGKQSLKPGGMFYTAQSGLWQTVWMEIVPVNYIEQIFYHTDYDQGLVHLKVLTQHSAPVECVISGKDMEPICINGMTNSELIVSLPDFHPWTPEDPFLYLVSLKSSADRVSSYFAMRKCDIQTAPDGTQRFFLNNKPYFQAGVLDQGYWPEGLYTPPSDAAVERELSEVKALGFNLLRKHAKIEPQRWYYHCDRLGLVVWQDMVNGGGRYNLWFVTYLTNVLQPLMRRLPDKAPLWGLLSRGSESSREEYRRELEATVQALSGHPCVGCWVPFNEGWGQFDAAGAVQAIRTLDDTRLVDEASGWYDQGGGDVCSIHNYFYPLHVKPGKRTVALSEYGGIAWPMPGHEAPGRTYGYGTAKSRADLTARCKKLQLDTVLPQLKKGLSALVYTQLTDVEDEVNGLFTYDRTEIKPDANAVRSVNAALAAEFAKVTR